MRLQQLGNLGDSHFPNAFLYSLDDAEKQQDAHTLYERTLVLENASHVALGRSYSDSDKKHVT